MRSWETLSREWRRVRGEVECCLHTLLGSRPSFLLVTFFFWGLNTRVWLRLRGCVMQLRRWHPQWQGIVGDGRRVRVLWGFFQQHAPWSWDLQILHRQQVSFFFSQVVDVLCSSCVFGTIFATTRFVCDFFHFFLSHTVPLSPSLFSRYWCEAPHSWHDFLHVMVEILLVRVQPRGRVATRRDEWAWQVSLLQHGCVRRGIFEWNAFWARKTDS